MSPIQQKNNPCGYHKNQTNNNFSGFGLQMPDPFLLASLFYKSFLTETLDMGALPQNRKKSLEFIFVSMKILTDKNNAFLKRPFQNY